MGLSVRALASLVSDQSPAFLYDVRLASLRSARRAPPPPLVSLSTCMAPLRAA